MKPETRTTIKVGGTIINAHDLEQDEKVAIIELAIHLAAPQIANMLAGVPIKTEAEAPITTEHDKLHFDLPPVLSVQEVADYLRISKQKIYEICRAYGGELFPSFKIGNRFRIDRDDFVEWLRNGGMNNYDEKIAALDVKRAKKKA